MKPDIQINQERLAAIFIQLCETDSPSREEGKVAALLKGIFSQLGAAEIVEDDSASETGSDTGNLFIRFKGTVDAEPLLLFNCLRHIFARCLGNYTAIPFYYSSSNSASGSSPPSARNLLKQASGLGWYASSMRV